MKGLNSIRSEVEHLKMRERTVRRRSSSLTEDDRRILDVAVLVIMKYRQAGKIEDKNDEVIFHDLTVEDEKVLDEACRIEGFEI